MSINGKTRLLGILGYPVGHSLSPVMQNKALQTLGLNWAYVPLPVHPDNLELVVRGLRALDFAGFNVTVPHKEAVLTLLDEVDNEAEIMGAVNTVVNCDGRLIGYNTDGRGFLRAVAEELNFTPAGQSVLIIGAGGSARAIAAALAAEGAREIIIANRSIERAKTLVKHLCAHYSSIFTAVGLDEACTRMSSSSLVVQTTSVGMHPDLEAEPVINTDALSTYNSVYDIIFNPSETRFLREARSQGCAVANGLSMLLHQGALGLEIWTGKHPPLEVMRKALFEA